MGLELAELKRRFLKLLEEDVEFRYTVAGYIGLSEVLKRFDKHDEKFAEILKRLDRHEAELVKLREDMREGFERRDSELARLREDMIAGFKRHDDELMRLREDMIRGFDLLRRHIDALGARWGLMTEEAFREGLRGLVSEELGLEVERWTTYDEGGMVYGYPSMVEVDLAVKDEKIILVEVSSHVRAADVATLKRKAELYAERTGRRPDRLVIITPFADEKALTTARELGIEIYTKV